MKITTTVIGSYPYARMAPEEAIERAVDEQVEAGVDVISDGQVRADMVGIFAQGIAGFDVQGRKYNVVGKIGPAQKAISISDLIVARDRAAGRAKVKGTLTGPTTMAHCVILLEGAPYKPHDTPKGAQSMIVDRELVMDMAHAMAAEAKFLSEAGFDTIQVDEPFFSMPDMDLDLGLEALGVVTKEIKTSALHVCGDITESMKKLIDAPVDIIACEGGHLARIDWLTPAMVAEKKKKICWGVIAVNTNDVETVEEVKGRITAGVEKLGVENILVSPDCGMRVRKPDAAKRKLVNMVAAAREVERELA
ncbi:MAG: methionine synthase [Nitrospinota bacterium]|nr:methionine synthase [Nitrospinota bacterium]